jgi:hypothetical protein
MLLLSVFFVLLLLFEQSSAVYYTKSYGSTCGDIFTSEECSIAAKKLHIPYGGFEKNDFYPQGCYVHYFVSWNSYYSKVKFNTYSDKYNNECSSNNKCVCQSSSSTSTIDDMGVMVVGIIFGSIMGVLVVAFLIQNQTTGVEVEESTTMRGENV